MRLINADALKEALYSNCDLCHDKNTNWCERCCPHNDFEDLIDNTPTVPQDCSECKRFDFPYVTMNVEFTEEEKQEIIERVRKDLLIFPDENANERPHGEWIDYNAYYKTCSICKRTVGIDFLIQKYEDKPAGYSFCPNCGARMGADHETGYC